VNVLGLIAGHVALAVAAQPIAASTPPSADASAQETAKLAEEDRFDKRLEAVDAAMAKVVDLRADFEQRRHTPLLKKPLVSKGTVLTKGERVRWDTATPRASTLRIEGGLIRLFYPSDRLVEEYPAGDGFRDLAGAPLPRLSVLRERFEVSQIAARELVASEGNSMLLAIRLTPKTDALKLHVTAVKVLIDESRPAATKVVMIDPDGEETEIVFSNVKLNEGVRDDEMELKLPEGVRVSRPLGDLDAAPARQEGTSATEPAAGGEQP
jgi:outer membrane lipoprotein-sorting protein